ncbi:SulP family inorganic anion transporter [Demequina pelophila]|uniref:SulP family inorganic anion transporter n=1 Tax=Demequina pelophila TaxID=1638984 RepID=UPI0007812624|nr:SulP family inorganic anion transporter [Demequina pelophila]
MTATGLRGLLPGRRDYADLPRTWRGDLLAGLTVGIVALPLALAFGVSSGAGAEAGLITAIVAGVVAAVFGGSHVQVSGPTGAMVVVLAPILAERGLGALALVSVLAGIFVVLAGVARLGRLVGLIPWPVLEGFTLGIAVIIGLQQIPAALGIDSGSLHGNAIAAAGQAIATADWAAAWPTLAVVAGVAAVMLLVPRLTRAVPGSVIAIALASIATSLIPNDIADIGELPAGLPMPALPAITLDGLTPLILPALTVAALAAIESLLSARVAASHSDTGAYDPDRELVGQGLASMAAGVFGGMPATGAIARTAVNLRSGGRTRLAAVTHALVLLAIVMIASGVVAHIPLAALSGVLMVTAATMVHGRTVRAILRSSRSDAVIFVITAIITVTVDLIYAVAIGIAVAALFALRQLASSGGVHREELAGPVAPGDDRIAVLRLDGALFFGDAQRVLDRVARIDGVRVVILRMSQLQLLDATGAQVLAELIAGLERRGVTVLVKGVQDRHERLVEHAGVRGALGHENHVYDDLAEAVAHARELVAGERSPA